MATELKLPLLGDVMTEGTLTEWLQPDGAQVRKGEPLYQLETDKVNYTVEAPDAGFLRQAVAAGSTVPVGTVVGQLDQLPQIASPSNGARQPEGKSAPAAAPAAAAAQQGPPLAEADSLVITPAARRLARDLGLDLAALPRGKRLREADVQAFSDSQRAPLETETQATPAARRLARQMGIDLAHVGVGGKLIREADVSGWKPGAPAAAPPAQGAPLSGRRRVIAGRMHSSLQEAAQLTISLEVSMTEALRLREQLKQLWPAEDQPTITDLITRATVLALRNHPALNATMHGAELAVHSSIDIGLAVDAEAGLIVPVIRDAGSRSLKDIARASRDLAAKARDNRLSAGEVHGGTFTITNLGTLGIDFFTPIINPPQVAILGVGRVFNKLALIDGDVSEVAGLYLNLTFDHRAIDGVPAARFLNEVKRFLELPVSLVSS